MAIAVCVANHAAMTGSRFAVTLVALRLGASTFEAGVAVALFAVVPMLGSVWLGRWVDRVGSRRPALAGMSATGAGLLLPVLWLSPTTLACCATAVGGGYALLVLAVQRRLGNVPDPAERGRALSAFAFGTALSSSIGPFAAGACVSQLGARPSFALGAAVALVTLVGTAARRGTVRVGEQGVAAAAARVRLARMLAGGSIRRVLMADLAVAVAWNANTFVVPVLGTQRAWPADQIGRMLAVFGAAVLLVRAVPAAWRPRLSPWAAIRLALASSGACLAALALCDRMPVALMLEAAMGLALGGALSSVLALLHDHAPARQAGEVLGLRLMLLNASAIALPLLLGGMAEVVDLASVLWGVALAVASGLLATLRANGSAPSAPAEPGSPA